MFVPHKTSHGRPHENKLKSEREKATADARIAGNHSELIKVSFEYCLVSSSRKIAPGLRHHRVQVPGPRASQKDCCVQAWPTERSLCGASFRVL